MSLTFLHTADWHLGKPFAGVADPAKRALLQNERLAAVHRIGEVARRHAARFVVVAGDLFDSARPSKATVAAACSAIGSLGIPVYAIPGNHDHGGAGSLWEEDFFRRECAQLAPNLRVLLRAEPVEAPGALLLPCPLLRRHDAADPTAWLRSTSLPDGPSSGLPRVVLAHGSALDFGPAQEEDDDELAEGSPNLLELDRLPAGLADYVALGDWHGTRQVGDRAWYSGTPELDRFVKGEDHDPGNVLVVTVRRGQEPEVLPVATGEVGWHQVAWNFHDDAEVEAFRQQVDACLGTRANRDLLGLRLEGALSIAASRRLEQLLEAWEARVLRVKVADRCAVAPSPEELEALTQRTGDPLVASVARKLAATASSGGVEAEVARLALRALHAALQPA